MKSYESILPFLGFIHPDDREKSLREMKLISGGSQSVNFENRYIHMDGSVRHLSWMVTPMLDEFGLSAAISEWLEEKVEKANALGILPHR